MARPNWNYIRVDVDLPDHEKLDGLSDKAFRTLIELWCWCGRHLTDGFVRDAKWNTFGTKVARAQLVAHRLAERVEGGYQMHDFVGEDGHQRSRAEVLEMKEKRRAAGSKGGRAKANAKQVLQQTPEHLLQQNASKTVAEAEAEAEAEHLVADVGDPSPVRNARTDAEIDLIIHELHNATGRTVDRQWAAKTLNFILDGRAVTDRAAYIRAAIRNDPDPKTRFLPLY